MMNVNQMGRELTRRLVEATGCDLQTAVRFFYNSELYMTLAPQEDVDMDALYARFEREFTRG